MTTSEGTPRSRAGFLAICLLALIGVAGFTALGIWQLERRVWKLALIEQVDQRVHAAPTEAPGPSTWPGITAAADEYRRLRVAGHFLNDRETLVQASTELGGGFWVLTPFQTDAGFTLLVNRGFVPPDRRDPATREAGQITGETAVTGLLRITEPKGGFLRANDPSADRWYSRDVDAIAAARGLPDTAPYFIDADDTARPGGFPRGGLTVISFPNSHLVYALTWFGLALMLACVTGRHARDEWRLRTASPHAAGPAPGGAFPH